MSKKFVRFCVPTLFERRELNLRSFANLIRQAEEADIDYEIDIIANQNFEYFRKFHKKLKNHEKPTFKFLKIS